MTESQIENEIKYSTLHNIILEFFDENILTKAEYEQLDSELIKEIKPLFSSLLT